jgi:hypothetical protein
MHACFLRRDNVLSFQFTSSVWYGHTAGPDWPNCGWIADIVISPETVINLNAIANM